MQLKGRTGNSMTIQPPQIVCGASESTITAISISATTFGDILLQDRVGMALQKDPLSDK
jgi:hypothetical protein